MQDALTIQQIATKYCLLSPLMDERMRRPWAALEATAYGWGGIQAVARATGLSPTTIRKGQAELVTRATRTHVPVPTRLRRPGAGRKRKTAADPELVQAWEELVDPVTRGDPDSPLRWTCKSTRTLARELTGQGHAVSDTTVRRLLHAADYSLPSNRKTREGAAHPDRNAQFAYSNARVRAFQQRGQPVIAVDTKKKELVGDFKDGGREGQPQGEPEEVRVHDFLDKKLGKAIPYGVYDVTENQGWVSVGIDHDTARFAAFGDPALVAEDGPTTLPRCAGVADHGGWRRQQRQPLPPVEGGSARPGQRRGHPDPGLSFPTGDEQGEQDRASDVLSHHPKLARPPAGQSRSDRQPDREHGHAGRVEDSSGTRHGPLPDRH